MRASRDPPIHATSTADDSPQPTMKIVVADDLPDSALDLLRAEPGWHVDARSGRSPAELAPRPRRRRRAASSAAPPRSTAAAARRGAPPAHHRPRRHRRRQRRRRRRQRAAAFSSSTRRAPTASASPSTRCALMLALARIGAGRRSGDEGRQVGEEDVPRHRAARQDARHRRPRPHRPGGGAARARRSACASSPTIRSSRARLPAALGVELLSLDELCADGRLPDAAPAVDRRDEAPVQRRAVRARASRASASSTRRAAS